MTKYSIAASCALTLATFGLVSTSLAGTTVSAGKESKPITEVVKESCITGDIGVNVVSQYISRGAVLEDQGVIAQPFIDLYFKLYSGDGFINSVSLNLGLWSSLHSEKTQAIDDSTTPSWYEFDYTVGLSATFAKNFTLSSTYLEYNYPNDNFGTQRIISTKLAYNDADLLGAFALNPYVKYEWYFENPGADGANYFEAGITPGFAAGPVLVSFPVVAGFGTNGFYGEDDGFAYISGGVALKYTLACIPECYGKWSVSAGYTAYYLDEDNGLSTFQVPEIRSEDEYEGVFSGGLIVEF